MNRILTTNAADGQPFLSPTSLDMLQDAYKTGFADIVKSMIGSTYSASVPYVLWGCETTSTPSITAGALFFNGEVITVAAWAPGVACLSSVPGLNIVASYAASDPVTYESGASHNTHQIRTAVASCGTSGTFTIGDFTDLYYFNDTAIETRADTNGDTLTFDRNRVISYAAVNAASTITIDGTGAREGKEIILYGTIANGTTFALIPGAVSYFPIFNVGANVASAARRYFRIKCVGIDRDNVFGVGVDSILITITDLNNA
jgi:hypothetical protein